MKERKYPTIEECMLTRGRLLLISFSYNGFHLITYANQKGIVKTKILGCFVQDKPHWVDMKL